MSKILLYLKEQLYQEMDIELPGNEPKLLAKNEWGINYNDGVFKRNFERRREYLNDMMGEMKINNTRNIIKHQYDYYFVIIIESKINKL